MSGGRAEREGERIPSRLHTVSAEPNIGLDLMIHETEPHVRLCADNTEPAWDSLSPSLCPSSTHILSQNKLKGCLGGSVG